MVSEVFWLIGGAGVVSLIAGFAWGSWFTGRRVRRQVEEVGEEVARLTRVAEEKLLEDDPHLPDLLKNLNRAIEQAYSAIDALENQSELTRRKTAGAREIAKSSRRAMALMEDMGAELPHVPTPKIASIASHPDGAPAAKPTPNLR